MKIDPELEKMLESMHKTPFLGVENNDYVLSHEDVIQLLKIGKYFQGIVESSKSGNGRFIICEDDVVLARRIYEIFCGDELLKISPEEDKGRIGPKIENYYIFGKDSRKSLESYFNNTLSPNGYLDGRNIIRLRRQVVDWAKEIFGLYDLRESITNGLTKSLGGKEL